MLDIQFSPFTVLTTERLILREITTDDAPEIFKLRSDVHAMKYIGRPLHTSVEEALTMIKSVKEGFEKNDSISWAITLKNENKLIGTVGYYRLKKEHHRGEIGYMLHPDYWKKGIVTEACKAALDYGFNVLKFHSIEADINPDNPGSVAVVEKLGFRKEAHFKENYYFEGKYSDTLIYSKLVSDH